MILVTGGCGFIGANFVLNWLNHHDEPIINLDALTYAGNLANLASVQHNPNYQFIHGDIVDRDLLDQLFIKYQPRALIHFAAESHVDHSINNPAIFMRTNIDGTFNLLEASRKYWNSLNSSQQQFRFLHISTDEVYGSLSPDAPAFTETNLYEPNSPYSASKAASDHLVRAWHHTYGLPVLTTHCSNNYGPFQFPEKLIPLVIQNALAGKALPIYGDGKNIRDWLYVTDHCNAIEAVLNRGALGEKYNIGGNNEKTNIELVTTICAILDKLRPQASGSYQDLIRFVKDRSGHDKRYAIDSRKIQTDLNWQPQENLKTGLEKTIHWYLNNIQWLNQLAIKKDSVDPVAQI